MSNPTDHTLPQQAKAVLAGGIAGVGALATALADEVVTKGEWAGVALAAIVAYGAVFGVKNAK